MQSQDELGPGRAPARWRYSAGVFAAALLALTGAAQAGHALAASHPDAGDPTWSGFPTPGSLALLALAGLTLAFRSRRSAEPR